jgi:Ca2+-transporting ATPase
MKQPPRDRDEPLVTAGLLRRILGESGAIALGALGAYGVGLARYGPGPIAQSMAFGSLMGAQLLHVLLARCGHRPVSMDQRPRNTALAFGVGLAAGLQAVALFYPPIRTLLGGAPLRLADLAISAAGAIIPIAIIEGGRLIEAAIRNRPSPSELSEQGADA